MNSIGRCIRQTLSTKRASKYKTTGAHRGAPPTTAFFTKFLPWGWKKNDGHARRQAIIQQKSRMTVDLSLFNSVRAYYKGTSIQAPIDADKQDEFLRAILEARDNQIRDALESGMTLKRLGDIYKAQLDDIEEHLCQSYDKYFIEGSSRVVMSDKQDDWVDDATKHLGLSNGQGVILWFVNILVLIKLKRIQDDDMNGLLVSKPVIKGAK